MDDPLSCRPRDGDRMNVLTRLWPRLETVHASLTESGQRRQSLLLARLLLALMLVAVLALAHLGTRIPGLHVAWFAFGAALGLLVAAFELNRRGRLPVAGALVVTALLAACIGAQLIHPREVWVYAYLAVPLFLARLFLSGPLFMGYAVATIACVLAGPWLFGNDWTLALAGGVYVAVVTTLFAVARRHRAAIEEDRRAALAASERDLRVILDNMQDTYYRTDADGRIVLASESATRLLGYTPRELLGMRLADFYVDADGRERFLAAFSAAGGVLQNYEAALRRRDGSVVWVSTNSQYVRDPRGRVTGIEGTTRDITERKRAEQALRDSEALLANAEQVAGIGSFSWDLATNAVQWSRQAYRLFGADPDDPAADIWRILDQRLHPDDKPRLAAAIERAQAGERTPMELRVTLPDGTLRSLWSEGKVVFDAQGRPLRMVGTMQDITERLHAEQQLRESEARFRTLSEVAFEGIFIHDQGRLVDANPTFAAMLGYSLDEIRRMTVFQLVVPAHHELVRRSMREGYEIPLEVTAVRKDGSTFTAEVFGKPLDYHGRTLRVASVRDITARLRSETEMRKLSSAVEQTADAIVITNREGIIEYVNPAFERTTGYARGEVIGRTPNLLKSGKQGAAFYQVMWQTILRGEVFSDVVINRRKDGTLFYEEKTITPLKDANGAITQFISTGRDVTERMQTQERLQYLAQHDVLTELPNRLLLLDRLRQALARARWHDRLVAVLFLDVDRFKTINDSLGHDVGDQLLTQLAARLGAALREGDTVARFGGDEFVMLLDDVAAAADVSGIAAKVLESMRAPFVLKDVTLHVGASIGVSLFPGDGEDAATLLKNADTAMYRAKEAGRNSYQFYSREMSARAFERLTLENNLRHAFERDEFRMHYQPQVDVDSGDIVGVEAVIRWQHPDFGLVAPSDFIPLLEETGLIVTVGEWVLATASTQVRAWRDAGWPRLRLAVNLSPRQFQAPGLRDAVARAMGTLGDGSGALELEITETLLVGHAPATLATLDSLKSLGARLAIDDFGTGYSSLSYLRRLPIETLKIDRSFVRDIPHDPDDSAIAHAITALAASLKLNMVAEGVENEAQRDFLRAHGCHVMQGFLFSRPLAAGEFERYLADYRASGRRGKSESTQH
jgi:diguanylate cyclase (GGDEF)-like protein/PAS domain S-box-containing protein